ncbi:MAG TPA: rhombotarget lipoprotein [Vicinamibacterales bacterium]|nr:rhombotarget lipoprotein [Vicinamibacterales bacterium]
MRSTVLWLVIAAILVGGCASKQEKQRQAASVVEFLYPGKEGPEPIALGSVAELKVPLRIGLAFVPDNSHPEYRITEAERIEMLGKIREAFGRYPFVSAIEIVPSMYLQRGGGFDNIDRVARLLSLDCVALLSYDQMQFADATGWAALYWTGIGVYMVPGDRYDVLTSVEAAIFDVRSRKLLMRAGGTSQVKGHATMVGFAGKAREARSEGFRQALEKLIPNLHAEVKAFRERAPSDRTIRLDLPPGYDPSSPKPATP